MPTGRQVEITTVAIANKLKPNTLEKQYKNILSDFHQFKTKNEKEIEEESFVFSKNFGEDMAIDETGLIDGELYTIVINKKAKGKKGTLAAIIKGTKSSIITRAISDKVHYMLRLIAFHRKTFIFKLSYLQLSNLATPINIIGASLQTKTCNLPTCNTQPYFYFGNSNF